jgi:hypothetical protein
MPHKQVYVKPEKYLTHKGVTIYRAYKEGDADEPFIFWFTTDVTEEKPNFDIRMLSTWVPGTQMFETKAFKKALRAAIDKGELRNG